MNLRKDTQVSRFVKAAKEFCSLLESHPKDSETWVGKILTTLADLYASAHHLPEIDFDNEVLKEGTFEVSDEEWKQVFHLVGTILGGQRYYRAYFDPSEPLSSKDKPLVADLADDLADIYRDLKCGLRAWDTGNDSLLPEIIDNWKNPLFAPHWGPHVLSAMRVLHPICFLRGIQKDHNKNVKA